MAKNSVPWQAWIATSGAKYILDELKKGEDAQKWANILERLESKSFQSSQDGFWRLSGPFHGRGTKATKPTTETLNQHGASQSRTFYRPVESTSHRFVMTSDAPKVCLSTPRPLELRVSVSDTEVVKILGSGVYPLRQHTSTQIEFSTNPDTAFGSLVADLVFNTV